MEGAKTLLIVLMSMSAVTLYCAETCSQNGIGNCNDALSCKWDTTNWQVYFRDSPWYYWTMVSSDSRQMNMTSKDVLCASPDPHCLTFQYRINRPARLSVLLRVNSEDTVLWQVKVNSEDNVLWQTSGSDYWFEASVPISTRDSFQLVIQATSSGDTLSFVFLSNISYKWETCALRPAEAQPTTMATNPTLTPASTTRVIIITEPPTVTAVEFTTLQTSTSPPTTANLPSMDKTMDTKHPRAANAEESDSDSIVIAVVVSLVLAVVVVVAVAVFIFKRRQMACFKANFLQREFPKSVSMRQRFNTGASNSNDAVAAATAVEKPSNPLYAVVKKPKQPIGKNEQTSQICEDSGPFYALENKPKKRNLMDNCSQPSNQNSNQTSDQQFTQFSKTGVSVYQNVQSPEHSNIKTNCSDTDLTNKDTHSKKIVTNEKGEIYFVLDKDPEDEDNDDYDDDEFDDDFDHPYSAQKGACNIEGSTSVYDVVGELADKRKYNKLQSQPNSIYHVIGETQDPGSAVLQNSTCAVAASLLQQGKYPFDSTSNKLIAKGQPGTKSTVQTQQNNKPIPKPQPTKKPIPGTLLSTKPILKPQLVKAPAQANSIYHNLDEETAGDLHSNTNDATPYYNVTNTQGASSLHVTTDDDNYNVLDFQDGRGAGAASKSGDGGEGENGQVYNHLDEGGEEGEYSVIDRENKTEVIDDPYSHIY